MKVSDIADFLDEFCPQNLAFDGDNVGLIVGRYEKEVSKVLLCLDVDQKAVQEAKREGADMIISHHPLMFHAIKRLTNNDPMQRTLCELIKNDISLFSCHTNLDCVRGGLNDYLAEKIGIKDTRVIEEVAKSGDVSHGFGRLGTVDDGTTLSDMLKKCIESLGISFVKYVGDPKRKIKTVAVNCGGGADEMDFCIQNGVDLFITGDVKYNPARDAYENSMALIDAGHYETEHIVRFLLKDILEKRFPEIEFLISKENIPIFSVYTG